MDNLNIASVSTTKNQALGLLREVAAAPRSLVPPGGLAGLPGVGEFLASAAGCAVSLGQRLDAQLDAVEVFADQVLLFLDATARSDDALATSLAGALR